MIPAIETPVESNETILGRSPDHPNRMIPAVPVAALVSLNRSSVPVAAAVARKCGSEHAPMRRNRCATGRWNKLAQVVTGLERRAGVKTS